MLSIFFSRLLTVPVRAANWSAVRPRVPLSSMSRRSRPSGSAPVSAAKWARFCLRSRVQARRRFFGRLSRTAPPPMVVMGEALRTT